LKPGATADLVQPFSTLTGCPEDGSLSVEICGQVNYTARTENGFRYASMSSVNNTAYRRDSQASLYDLTWDVAATGACDSSCSNQNHYYSGGQMFPGNGTTYTWNVSWSGQYQRVSASPIDVQGETEDLEWHRGTGVYHLSQTLDVPTS
jgi:hypothetical protein